jgi:YfiH family protein
VAVRYRFTDRKGGVSAPPFSAFNLGSHVGDDPAAVSANRSRLVDQVGIGAIVWMDQVHSATVQVVTAATAEPVAATDGMVTRTPGLGLAVLVADCVPVLAYDEVAGVIGVAHAGRTGAAAGIGAALIGVMVGQGADPARITAILGPSVCGRCYEVPETMRDAVAQELPGSSSVTDRGTPALDLPAGLEHQLRAAGVARVRRDPRCTLEDDTLFSHRRQAPTGRQAGVIWLEDADSRP